MGGSWEDPGHSVGLSHLLPVASGGPEDACKELDPYVLGFG